MREPVNDQDYLDLLESLADQWVENALCSETIEEVISVNHWYMSSITSLMSHYFHKRMKELYN